MNDLEQLKIRDGEDGCTDKPLPPALVLFDDINRVEIGYLYSVDGLLGFYSMAYKYSHHIT